MTIGFAPSALLSSCNSRVTESLFPREVVEPIDDELSVRIFELTCADNSASFSSKLSWGAATIVDSEFEFIEVGRGGDSTFFHKSPILSSLASGDDVPAARFFEIAIPSSPPCTCCGVVAEDGNWDESAAAGESTSFHVLDSEGDTVIS